MKTFRLALIRFFTFIGGLYFFLEFVLPADINGWRFAAYHDQILLAIQVVGAMAIGLGIINIARVHGGRVIRGRRYARDSLVLLLAFVGTLVVQGIEIFANERRSAEVERYRMFGTFTAVVHRERSAVSPGPRLTALEQEVSRLPSFFEQAPLGAGAEFQTRIQAVRAEITSLRTAYETQDSAADLLAVKLQQDFEGLAATASVMRQAAGANFLPSRIFHLIFEGLYSPLGASMFALLAFYIATAAYRAFRVRSLEALVMMCAALVVMLGQIPFGPLYISDTLPEIRRWLLQTVNTAAFRAIYFGAAIAGLSMAVRMWLSLERGPLEDRSTED